jgi:hypothetical protein
MGFGRRLMNGFRAEWKNHPSHRLLRCLQDFLSHLNSSPEVAPERVFIELSDSFHQALSHDFSQDMGLAILGKSTEVPRKAGAPCSHLLITQWKRILFSKSHTRSQKQMATQMILEMCKTIVSHDLKTHKAIYPLLFQQSILIPVVLSLVLLGGLGVYFAQIPLKDPGLLGLVLLWMGIWIHRCLKSSPLDFYSPALSCVGPSLLRLKLCQGYLKWHGGSLLAMQEIVQWNHEKGSENPFDLDGSPWNWYHLAPPFSESILCQKITQMEEKWEFLLNSEIQKIHFKMLLRLLLGVLPTLFGLGWILAGSA